MSLSKPARKQSGRVISQKSKTMRHSTTEAEKHTNPAKPHTSSPRDSPDSKHPQPDSGFFENADGDLSATDPNLPSCDCTDEDWTKGDWIIYPEQNPDHDLDYYLREDDATDIASVKANHGSNYNGKNNEDDTLIAKRRNSGKQSLQVIYESPRRNDPPAHFYSSHPVTRYSISTLDKWKRTFEQHESLAYRFEQPPDPHHVFQHLQSWNEEIDLDIYAVRN